MLIAALMLAQAATATPIPAKDQTPTAKVECRMIQEAHSRIPKKICRLDKKWELLAKDAQDELRSSRNSRSIPANYVASLLVWIAKRLARRAFAAMHLARG